jgi:hypothetical protein
MRYYENEGVKEGGIWKETVEDSFKKLATISGYKSDISVQFNILPFV